MWCWWSVTGIYMYDNISMDLPCWTFGVLKHFENVAQRFGSGV